MSIYVQVPVLVALTNEEKDVLSRVLQYKEDSDLEGALARIGRAALTEYLEMILGKQVPTRANEIYERRLFHLIKHISRAGFRRNHMYPCFFSAHKPVAELSSET